jgi:pimeloyl-ACP methyl ester carboxylesterase
VSSPWGPVDTLVGGDGPPLVVLHDDTGRGPWSAFHRELATRFTVHAPSMPGYDASPRCEWMRDVRQLAVVMAGHLRELGAGPDHPVHLVGRGLGGWVAAQVLTFAPELVSRAVLLAPYGVRPPQGAYVDQFLVSSTEWVQLGFATDAQFEAHHGTPVPEAAVDGWELNREMTTRIAWRPYLYDQGLPHLLAGVRTPTLVVAATGDRIVPESVPRAFASLIPGATWVGIDAGHSLELEAPVEVAACVAGFLAAPVTA